MTTEANDGVGLDMPASHVHEAAVHHSSAEGQGVWSETDRSIVFQDGLPGFPEASHFELGVIDPKMPLLMSLRSTDDAELSFVVMAFTQNMKVYGAEENQTIERIIGCSLDDCALLGMLTLNAGPNGVEAFVNLRAPIVIQVDHRRGFQVVLPDPELPFRQSIGCIGESDFPKLPTP